MGCNPHHSMGITMDFIVQWNKKTQNIGEFKLILIGPKVLDVFWGMGFDNWARVKRDGKDFILIEKNKSLPKNIVGLFKLLGEQK